MLLPSQNSENSQLDFRYEVPQQKNFVKHEDELSQRGATENKVRKFASLNSPGALSGINAIVSYGGAQSNTMLALANIANHNSISFVYITGQVPDRIAVAEGNV